MSNNFNSISTLWSYLSLSVYGVWRWKWFWFPCFFCQEQIDNFFLISVTFRNCIKRYPINAKFGHCFFYSFPHSLFSDSLSSHRYCQIIDFLPTWLLTSTKFGFRELILNFSQIYTLRQNGVLLKYPGPALIWEEGPVCFCRFY